MMNEEEIRQEKNNILYRPDLDYDKKYDTEGYQEEVLETEDYDKEPVIESLKKDIDNIKKVLPLLPGDLIEMAKKPLIVIESVIGDLDVENKPVSNEESVVIITGKKEDEDEDIYPDTFFRDDEDPFVIISDRKDKVTIIKETYDYDLASVIADYIDKLNKVMNDYLNSLLTVTKSIDKSQYSKVVAPYTGSTSNVSKDYKHLSDLIIRSQLTRQMKSRLYNKRFNLDNSIAHIRICKAGVEQKIRYYEASYQNGTTYTDLLSNRHLENSRMMYDKKYKQNFFNLYKYLNSSVILLDECFKMHINEAQAKIILMMKEGNELW
jgi:hypothetical protein|nr:MAG TPA: hypothetical protein [Caudoviricetes sp.]